MASNWAHRWFKRKALPWNICARCGLIALHNERSQRAVKAPCPAGEPDAE